MGNPLFHLQQGSGRLLVSVPHAGTILPPDIASLLTPIGRAMVDTDWHVDRLVGFAAGLGATLLIATHSRTVIDLNRAPGGALLYPGLVETALCASESFAGEPLYAGAPPDASEIEARRVRYWQPYHDTLAAELARIKSLHGVAHLLDAHSIASKVPRLFDGRLPDLNIGTNDGASAGRALIDLVTEAVARHGNFSMIRDGRFKGGAITRVYGKPTHGVQAIQIEIAQSAYLDESDPQLFSEARAAGVVAALRSMVDAML